MINKIATLSAQLRQKGLPVSVRSTQSAVQVYMALGEDDRQLLKNALMSVYVKDKYDIPRFNKVFDGIKDFSLIGSIDLSEGFIGIFSLIIQSDLIF